MRMALARTLYLARQNLFKRRLREWKTKDCAGRAKLTKRLGYISASANRRDTFKKSNAMAGNRGEDYLLGDSDELCGVGEIAIQLHGMMAQETQCEGAEYKPGGTR